MAHRKTKATTDPMQELPRLLGRSLFIGLIIFYGLLSSIFLLKESISYLILGLFISIVGSLSYFFIVKKQLPYNVHARHYVRIAISYLITMMTIFFYTLAMVRSDQLTDIMRIIILLAGLLIWYVIFKTSQDFINQLAQQIIQNKTK